MTEERRRLLLVEDESLMSALLSATLSGAGFEVRTAANAAEARSIVEDFSPHIMLIDIFLGAGPNGIQLANVIARANPEIGLLMLTKFKDALSSNHDLSELPPNSGFLRKDLITDTEHLLKAVDAVLGNRGEEFRQGLDDTQGIGDLNKKQLHVLRLVAEGLTNAEIASRTELSVKSVERYLASIFDDLDISSDNGVNQRVEAARRYYLSVGIPSR